jgi:DNA-binding PadR family transcriptional regulator
MATKGYVSKAKGVYNDKMLTQYTLTDEGRAELDKEPEAEVTAEGAEEDAE